MPSQEDALFESLQGYLLDVDWNGQRFSASVYKRTPTGIIVRFTDGSTDIVYYDQISQRVSRMERCVD